MSATEARRSLVVCRISLPPFYLRLTVGLRHVPFSLLQIPRL